MFFAESVYLKISLMFKKEIAKISEEIAYILSPSSYAT
jgi:hypothetical protein